MDYIADSWGVVEKTWGRSYYALVWALSVGPAVWVGWNWGSHLPPLGLSFFIFKKKKKRSSVLELRRLHRGMNMKGVSRLHKSNSQSTFLLEWGKTSNIIWCDPSILQVGKLGSGRSDDLFKALATASLSHNFSTFFTVVSGFLQQRVQATSVDK